MQFSEFVGVLINLDYLFFLGIPSNFWTQWYLVTKKFSFITIKSLPIELIKCLFSLTEGWVGSTIYLISDFFIVSCSLYNSVMQDGSAS